MKPELREALVKAACQKFDWKDLDEMDKAMLGEVLEEQLTPLFVSPALSSLQKLFTPEEINQLLEEL